MLFALIAVSVVTTAVVLASAVEVAMSLAHRDALRDLHAAEGAIAAYLAERGAGLAPVQEEPFTAPGATLPMRITVERLARSAPQRGFTDSNARYAITATPKQSGRSVTVMVQALQQELPPFSPAPRAALTAGAGGRVTGGGTGGHRVSDGSDGEDCAAEHAEAAVVHPRGAPFYADEHLLLGGSIDAPGDADELIAEALGGAAIRDLAWSAAIRFGSHFGEAAFDPEVPVRSGSPSQRYDWGCPAELVAEIGAASGDRVEPCAAGAEPGFRIVAIDGENAPVRIGGVHGEGILIVINGPLEVTGPFIFRGLIVAERSVLLTGGGPDWPASIAGAVVSRGELRLAGDASAGPESGTRLTRAVRFDRCALDAVTEALNTNPAGRWGVRGVQGRTYAWSELVR